MKLIITPTYDMAKAVAGATGEYEETTDSFVSRDTHIVWTHGDVVGLNLNDRITDNDFPGQLNARQIAAQYYTPVVREQPSISSRDYAALRLIEQLASFVQEIIFITYPWDDGEKYMQALIAFLSPQAPCRRIVLQEMTENAISDALCRMPTPKLDSYLSDNAMRRVVAYDMVTTRPEELKGSPAFSDKAGELLKNIKKAIDRQEAGAKILPDKAKNERTYTFGTYLSLETATAILSAKYGMGLHSIMCRLVSLYEKGKITNPVTHCKGENPMCGAVLGHVGPILPAGSVDKSMLGVPYDHINAPDEPISRDAAVYSLIVEHTDKVKGGNVTTVVCPSYESDKGLPLAEILSKSPDSWVAGASASFVADGCIGSLIEQLIRNEMVYIDDECVHITEEGHRFLDFLNN